MSRSLAGLAVAATLFGGLAGGCGARGAATPQPVAAGWTLGPDRAGERPVRGVALLDEATVVLTDGARARRIAGDGTVAWETAIGAEATGVAIDGELAAVAVGGPAGTAVPGLAGGLRGEPGAAIVALAVADGAARWTVGVGATRWSLVSHVGPSGAGFLVTGSFAGTLRVGERTVTSAGLADGFVAELDRAGAVRSLVRVGGDGADAVSGAVALGGGSLAIAGTFTGAAELRGAALAGLVPDAATADGFVAVLDATGQPAWSRVWGGPAEDTCAGVVALAGGAIAVAGTVRGELDVAGRSLTVRGGADGLVAVFAPDASVRAAWLLGGDDFDGVTGIAGDRDHLAVSGWFSGTLPSPDGALRADGVDDAFLALAAVSGPTRIVPLASAGPAQVSSVTASTRGVAIGVHAAGPVRMDAGERPAGASVWFQGW